MNNRLLCTINPDTQLAYIFHNVFPSCILQRPAQASLLWEQSMMILFSKLKLLAHIDSTILWLLSLLFVKCQGCLSDLFLLKLCETFKSDNIVLDEILADADVHNFRSSSASSELSCWLSSFLPLSNRESPSENDSLGESGWEAAVRPPMSTSKPGSIGWGGSWPHPRNLSSF